MREECDAMRVLVAAFIVLASSPVHAQGISTFMQDGASFLGAKLPKVDRKQILKVGGAKLQAGAHVRWTLLDRDHTDPALKNCRSMVSISRLFANSPLTIEIVRREAERGLAVWSDVADLHFEYVASVEHADIIVGAQAVPEGWAFADITFKTDETSSFGTITKAAVCFNPERLWSVDDSAGAYCLRHTFAHEFGHTLGLDHPQASTADFIMSYKYYKCDTPAHPLERKAIQYLYGETKKPPSG